MINIIVAYSKNRVIGEANNLPWYIPEDLKRFKKLTNGHSVIMGRKTYESIVDRLGHELPNRRNIVVSSTISPVKGTEVVASLERALKLAKGDTEVFIIGGESVYRESLETNVVDRIYATEIHKAIDGDTYFPNLDSAKWLRAQTDNRKDDNFSYSFVIMERKK